MLDDFLLVLIAVAASFKTFEEQKLNLVHLSSI